MKTINEILIDAPAARIFTLAAATSAWPRILPHYRFVKRLSGDDRSCVVHMGARRDALPVQWTARQENMPEIPEIRFTHIRGWTRGMDVVWRFSERGNTTLVTIEHQLQFQFPIAAEWLGEHVVGRFFVAAIAQKTLQRMKMLAEMPQPQVAT